MTDRVLGPWPPRRMFMQATCCLLLLAAGAAAELIEQAGPADWPEFRGPWGNGHAQPPGSTAALGLPLLWSENQNVTWKTPIPHRGWSSPVVLNGQLWLTTATLEGHDLFVLCIDAASGEIVHHERLFHEDNPEPLGNSVNGYASPTPVAEPGRVYVHFGSYGTACLDAATAKVLWERRDLHCRHYRGPGSSPLLFEDLLVLTFDGVDVQYVAALDKHTGRTVWRTDRSTAFNDLDENGQPEREGDLRKAFSTPLSISPAAGPQLISLGAKAGFAYHPRTGKEIWKTHHRGHSSSARPVFGNGLVYITTGHSQTEVWAIRPDGIGDITDTHVVWTWRGRAVPKQPSPVLVGTLLFLLSNEGAVGCLDALTGAVLWEERIGGNYMASLLYADGRLYCPSVQGKTIVLEAGRRFKELAENKLDEGCLASPAVSGSALFLRTKSHLYRIETKKTGE